MAKYVKSNTDNGVTVRWFLEQAEDLFKSYFPDSECVATLRTNLGNHITIDWFLSADKSECAHGLRQNDMFHICFAINDIGGAGMDDTLPENLVMEMWDKMYYIKPENNYLAYEFRDLPFRKTKGDAKKLLQTMTRYARTLKEYVLNDYELGQIHPNYIQIVEDKVVKYN